MVSVISSNLNIVSTSYPYRAVRDKHLAVKRLARHGRGAVPCEPLCDRLALVGKAVGLRACTQWQLMGSEARYRLRPGITRLACMWVDGWAFRARALPTVTTGSVMMSVVIGQMNSSGRGGTVLPLCAPLPWRVSVAGISSASAAALASTAGAPSACSPPAAPRPAAARSCDVGAAIAKLGGSPALEPAPEPAPGGRFLFRFGLPVFALADCRACCRACCSPASASSASSVVMAASARSAWAAWAASSCA
eukprot:scaffold17783_cov68-Phaeocystis_antarctica.AAC.8